MRHEQDIFWIGGRQGSGLTGTSLNGTGLAIVLRPRGERWLEQDMRALRDGGLDNLVSLLEPEEAAWLGLAKERRAADHAGIRFLSYPIPDGTVPVDEAGFRGFIDELAGRLARGERIGVHCQGSIGRATVTAACTLVHRGWSPRDALDAIEAARGRPVPDTEEQLRWILAYEAAQ